MTQPEQKARELLAEAFHTRKFLVRLSWKRYMPLQHLSIFIPGTFEYRRLPVEVCGLKARKKVQKNYGEISSDLLVIAMNAV